KEAHRLKGLIVALGDNYARFKVASRVLQICPDLPFVTAIHPAASIGRDVSLGDGTVVMPGVAVGPGCAIGRFCILNTCSSLDHDSRMDDFSSLAPRATVGGNCRIGAHGAISMGAVLIHGIQVGEAAVIGAGSTVLESIPAFKVAYGTPARVMRSRKACDRYL
ncbi:MAG: acetyltransferase, partial [Acidobacteriota bacterium]